MLHDWTLEALQDVVEPTSCPLWWIHRRIMTECSVRDSTPWIPACDVLHSGKRWFSSFSLLDPSFSKRSASWTNFDLVVGDMYLKYWWRTLGLGLHRTTSFLAFFSIRNDQEWGRRTSCGQQNFSSPGLESLFVSQLNSRFELGSVRTESKFCYFEGF